MQSWRFLLFLLARPFLPGVKSDDCQPHQWKRDVDDIVCRYWATSPAEVNYYTCTQLALKYEETVEDFFFLNPTMDRDCETIQPNTDYCVRGYAEPLVSTDGSCGPSHGDIACPDATPCCNSETWQCGDTSDDCAPGTCYSGLCLGGTGYSLDGNCGPDNGGLKCGGKWGDCCSIDGVCGTGPDFCGPSNCESGACTNPATPTMPTEIPWQTGTTPDGSCGGAMGYTCDVVFGNCCNEDGVCGSRQSDCGTGCQPNFGMCDGVTKTSATPTPTPTDDPTSPTSPGSTPTATGDPMFVPSYGPFTLAGCYREPEGKRALANLYFDEEMTVEKCLDKASTYAWAGIEYGTECWYGFQLDIGAAQEDLNVDNCGFVCPGNPGEYCGSGGHLVLYSSSTQPPDEQPSQPAEVNGHPWYGCMTEATDARALSADTIDLDVSMSLEFCSYYCEGYTYFGVEYGRECYCGNSFNAGSVIAPASDCNMLCSGNYLEFCGAGNRLSVYGV